MRAAATGMLAALAATAAQAGDAATGAPADRGAVTILFENDLFGGEDKKYTNGTILRYTAPRNELPMVGRWGRVALDWLTPAQDWYATYGAGQLIFTSSDINDPDPPLDDRPYAGFLFLSFALSADAGDRLDTVGVEVGMVGPASLAEQTQQFIHDNIIGDDPRGWDTQLRNEPAFRVIYEQRRRYGAALPAGLGGYEVDAIPQVSGSFGTLDISGGAGLTVRLGQGLEMDYGPQRVRRSVAAAPRPLDGLGWYVFAGVEGRAVARNLFLDGNTFVDSRRVDSEPFVGEAVAGFAVQWREVTFSYTHVFRSEEFKSQKETINFGSLNLSVPF